MKEYKIWKFIPGKYLQTVTVSLEKEHKNFIHIRLLHRIFVNSK